VKSGTNESDHETLDGWGDETINYPLPASIFQYLEERLGKGAHLETVRKLFDPDDMMNPAKRWCWMAV
jgi:hypothetical protein